MADVPPPLRIDQSLIMLCEGDADNEFFRRLIRSRQLPAFCFPFPPIGSSEGPPLYGRDGFVNMLGRLNSLFRLNPELEKSIRGILIALDSTNAPNDSFTLARDQIATAGEFGVPPVLGAAALSANRPPIAIITVPTGSAGSLETLCVAALRARFPDHANCMDAFLECCPTDYTTWNAEGLDKARLRCMIAATYRSDPSRSTRLIFAHRNSDDPAVDINHNLFDSIANEIRSFCRNIRAV
jgi:hypothetical protein